MRWEEEKMASLEAKSYHSIKATLFAVAGIIVTLFLFGPLPFVLILVGGLVAFLVWFFTCMFLYGSDDGVDVISHTVGKWRARFASYFDGSRSPTSVGSDSNDGRNSSLRDEMDR